jgi:hypothetical protein
MPKFSLMLEGRKQHTFSAKDLFEAQALALEFALYHGHPRSIVDVAEYVGGVLPMADEFMNRWRKEAQATAKRYRSGEASFR